MALNQAQLVILRAAIDADPVLVAMPNDTDSNILTANAFNLNASPNFTVWKTLVTIDEVGNNFVGTELAGLTQANQARLQTIAQYSLGGVNPSVADRRAFFDDVFSAAGGAGTRAKLLILWKRLATRAEKLYATGTGSDAIPALLTFEGQISYQDVNSARNLP